MKDQNKIRALILTLAVCMLAAGCSNNTYSDSSETQDDNSVSISAQHRITEENSSETEKTDRRQQSKQSDDSSDAESSESETKQQKRSADKQSGDSSDSGSDSSQSEQGSKKRASGNGSENADTITGSTPKQRTKSSEGSTDSSAQKDSSGSSSAAKQKKNADQSSTSSSDSSSSARTNNSNTSTSSTSSGNSDSSSSGSTAGAQNQTQNAAPNSTDKMQRRGRMDMQNNSGSNGGDLAGKGMMQSGASASKNSDAAEKTTSIISSLTNSEVFTDRDLKQEADTSGAKTITVQSDKTIDITEAGVYVVSGTASNCTIKVNADNDAKVQLVLSGVNITNTSIPAIYVVNADKCFVTTASSTTNSLSVTGTFTSDGDTKTDAVVFSKDDLVFNGLGTLNITSKTNNGIAGKDDINFTGGTYVIDSAKDSIEANDSISISGGNFTITSSKDALHCENEDDDSKGMIYISGGTFKITAKSDSIQGNCVVKIDGGTFDLNSAEGIEGTFVQINNGTINIKSSDDGINAANKSKSVKTAIEINGGKLTIVMGQGDTDAIDSNGDITVNGGTINITATVSSFDCDGTAAYNGGDIYINGTKVNSIPQSMQGGGRGNMGGMRW